MDIDSKILDPDTIESLQDLSDDEDDFLGDLINVFFKQSNELLASIKTSIQDKNSENLIKASHKLKGSCLNLGAHKMADICKTLELKGKEEDFTNTEKLSEELEISYELTAIELKKIKN